jgi:hypothetical protein
MNDAISAYTTSLRSLLGMTLSSEYVEEAVSEVHSHLRERAGELRATGEPEPEEMAVQQFGPVGEIAAELAKGYPPKPMLNPRLLFWLPEAALASLLYGTYECYSVYGGVRGAESSALVQGRSTTYCSCLAFLERRGG